MFYKPVLLVPFIVICAVSIDDQTERYTLYDKSSVYGIATIAGYFHEFSIIYIMKYYPSLVNLT